ncbi:vascular endothelial zinc finger 1-like isoform X2 [Alosa alosa]|uniref:vascular endothelial zinc finger 1 isoform X2 n=1 Tax=Alosa sapidissima TaxID=34773 RepID=UPI001C09A01E|nr:vascular endothelial zinc finger 1 isoform X2 [Alosa sapidissima]XP_048093757.1 vascular endothelial zinc finger 1-like isoform X2 [Alosa alosa]
MEPSWSTFLFQQANEALHHQHQVAQNSLLPLLNSNAEPVDQKPVMPIPLDQKPPVSQATGQGGGGGGGGGGGSGGGPMAVVKKEHKTKTPFVCSYCNKAFRDSYHLRRHESCHTGIKMVSRPKKAPQSAPTMVPLISSMQRENSGGNPSYISTIAGILTTATTSASTGSSVMSSVSMGTMQQQQQPQQPKKPPKPVKKNHGCEMCGKAFRDVYHLNRHKLSHSDEKPFECPICHQRFKRKDRMTYHVRSHDGGVHKPYICSVCGKGFSRPDHLSCHVKHVHSSERPFKCQVTACTSAFATKDRLRSHMIRHEGKVTCNICGKMLSAAYITSHLKTHGQQTNFNNCNKDSNDVCNSSSITHVTSSTPIMSRGGSGTNSSSGSSNPVTIATAMSLGTNTVNITSPMGLQHPVTITGPVNIASVNIPTTAHMNIAHPVAITTPMAMNIAGPLNIAMRPMDSMPFLSQVLPSSPPWSAGLAWGAQH